MRYSSLLRASSVWSQIWDINILILSLNDGSNVVHDSEQLGKVSDRPSWISILLGSAVLVLSLPYLRTRTWFE